MIRAWILVEVLFIGCRMKLEAFVKTGKQFSILGNKITQLLRTGDGKYRFGYCEERVDGEVYGSIAFDSAFNEERMSLNTIKGCNIHAWVIDPADQLPVMLAANVYSRVLWKPWSSNSPIFNISIPISYSDITASTLLVDSLGSSLFGGVCQPKNGGGNLACIGRITLSSGAISTASTVATLATPIQRLQESRPAGSGYFGLSLSQELAPILLKFNSTFDVQKIATLSGLLCKTPPYDLINIDDSSFLLHCSGPPSIVIKLSKDLLILSQYTAGYILNKVILSNPEGVSYLFGGVVSPARIVVWSLDLSTFGVSQLPFTPSTVGFIKTAYGSGSSVVAVGTNSENRIFGLTIDIEEPMECATGWVRYLNRECKEARTEGCSKVCSGTCLEPDSRSMCNQACNVEGDPNLESVAFLHYCQCKLEYEWHRGEQRCKRRVYQGCHYLCGSICLEANNSKECGPECNSGDPLVDASQLFNNECRCKSPAYFAEAEQKCLSPTENKTNPSNGTNTSAGARSACFGLACLLLTLLVLL